MRYGMKRMAMTLCLILALGWISDTSMLSLKIGERSVKGIQIVAGYECTISFDKWSTRFSPTSIPLQIKLGWKPIVLVNGVITPATRLGNGWLFEFKQKAAKWTGKGNTT